jgi:Uma2 family endonuclease
MSDMPPFTLAHWRRLPEGFPAQLVEGDLVCEPPPTYGHQRFQMRLLQALLPLVPDGYVVAAPSGVEIDEHNAYEPDLLVLRRPPGDRETNVGIPRLAIEVLSPSTARLDRTVKCARLLKAGVEEVWLVDARAGTVERHDAAGVEAAQGEERLASRALPGFAVVPAVLFAPPGSTTR